MHSSSAPLAPAGARELRTQCLQWLMLPTVPEKAQAVQQAAALPWHVHPLDDIAEPPGLPPRHGRPPLVPPNDVPRRSVHTPAGRAAMLHALAHIEANAIDLALDACWRFAGMPDEYYRDWWHVACDEALHFTLLREHLLSLGHDYGDLPAHDGLWEMARKTSHDVLARMALVPRLLEARGLDATPAVRDKFAAAGDSRACEILDVILRDEVAHVAIGNRWFHWLCVQRGVQPQAEFARLVAQHAAPLPKPPFNLDARRRAGFGADELAQWSAPASGKA